MPCQNAKNQQVLSSIFGNGTQAMQMGGIKSPKFIIHTYLEQESCMACIEIEDNGPGMGEATRKRLFEPFFTTKQVGTGTGLGLSASYFIITENHGGEMAIENLPGSGTNLIIRLSIKKGN